MSPTMSEPSGQDATSEIVVGVDGSDGARLALEWAVAEARLRGARLVAVHTWEMPPLAMSAGPFDPPTTLDPDIMQRVEAAARGLLDRELDAVDVSGLEVDKLVEPRNPVDALLDAAREADLLVVGTRGHGGFSGLLLGSVSQQVSHHAPCPVVIVPRPEKE
jgi:nucleotide-binding universal stress UspA family protein